MPRSEVLIVGAGPTGLVLALWLTRMGVRVRIVDQASAAGETSRALVVHARTLELYRQMDLASPVVDGALAVDAVNLWGRGEKRARVDLDAMGQGFSPFPTPLIYPQDRHEKMLIERLAAAGVPVERPTDLLDFDARADGVAVRFRHADGSIEACEADYLAGCDGAASSVRHGLRLGFPGGTYTRLFYVADLEASGPPMNGELHLALDDADFLMCFPLKGDSQARLIGTVRDDAGRKQDLGWGDVDQRAIERMRLQVGHVNWFSTYRVHHRVASAFRVGRVFLLGDAAHIHSPVGGQGMNTGIGDGVNLAWKLAATLRGRADPRILDSYEAERVPFAQRLVRTTDRAFQFVASEGELSRRVRADVVPRLLPALFRWPAARRFLFGTVSQIKVHYRASPLSDGHAGAVRGGDRLPWVPDRDGADNFAPLSSLDWQVHVYGEPQRALRQVCEARHLPLHAFPWEANAERAGLARDDAYLVRPDGYVGFAAAAPNAPERLGGYLDARRVRLPDA